MDKPYSIALQGISTLPVAEKIAAEVRFTKTIERSLGSAEAVIAVYRGWLEASESDPNEVSQETRALAQQWPKAFSAAQQAGLKNIGEGDAHFELHLELQSQAH